MENTWRLRVLGSCVTSIVVLAACGSGPDRSRPAAPDARPAQPAVGAGAVHHLAAEAADPRPRVVILGDSITAGLGLSPEQAYPALLQKRLDAAGFAYQVVNAGQSGDTSAGGLSRVDLALEGDVGLLVLALGGNDGLRGIPPDVMRRNLAKIIERAQARGIRVVLAGMEAPPNFGRSYTVSFHDVFPDLAKTYGVTLMPFLLADVAGIDRLNQRDGIHPTAEGDRIIADNMWAVIEGVLKRIPTRT